jgi:hypothetical protein
MNGAGFGTDCLDCTVYHGRQRPIGALATSRELSRGQTKQYPRSLPFGRKPSGLHPNANRRSLPHLVSLGIPYLTPEDALGLPS